MNVTDGFTDDGRMLVHLRVNRRNAAAVARSLQRYGYEVVGGTEFTDIMLFSTVNLFVFLIITINFVLLFQEDNKFHTHNADAR